MTNSQTKISTFYYNKSGNFCLIVCHEALFNWKLFKLGSVSVKDIRKNVPILQVGGSSHILSTPPVVWVVLLHKMAFCQSFISTTVAQSAISKSFSFFILITILIQATQAGRSTWLLCAGWLVMRTKMSMVMIMGMRSRTKL